MIIFRRREFSEYNLGIVNDTLASIVAESGCPLAVSASFSGMPVDAVDIEFLSGNRLNFRVSDSFPSLERRNYFINRWLPMWPLFAAVKQRHPDLIGSCRLWLDDNPSGPGLAFCGSLINHVLIPDAVYMETAGYESTRAFARRGALLWNFRKEEIFWRGASTGYRSLLGAKTWQELPRFKLCLMADKLAGTGMFDMGISQIVQIWDPVELAEIEAANVKRPSVALHEFANYRHSVDIDGNTCSWPGLFTKLLMGIAVIKVASPQGFRQWYYDRLLPWRNFIPLSAEMTDLPEIAEWLMTHPEEASAIASRGKTLAEELSVENVFDDVVPRIRSMVG